MRASPGLVAPVAAIGAAALVSPNGVGRLPAMGWSSWNEYACNINEDVFLRVAELFVDLGLKDVGYQYVNIDDCWSDKEKFRNATTGRIVVDSVKFPNGIDGLADEIHAKGLKLGIYSDAGTLTCGKYEGSLGHEGIDAETFADWGIDYLKYDNCNYPAEWEDQYPNYPQNQNNKSPPPGYDYAKSNTSVRYNRMRDALLAQERTILYSLSPWGHAHVERWGNDTGHSWRMWGDIIPKWSGSNSEGWGILPYLNQAAKYWNHTGFWGHNDWDMLEVGNGDLTLEESRSHFALWAAIKSPLIIGTKLDIIQEDILAVLKNEELIAFNQDEVYSDSAMPFGLTGPIQPTTPGVIPPDHWVGTSVKGIHLFLLNTKSETQEIKVSFDEVPGLQGSEENVFLVHDMWTGEDLGEFEGQLAVNVTKHDTAALRLTAVDGKHPNAEWTPRSTVA
jgi:alpha-galactosidase